MPNPVVAELSERYREMASKEPGVVFVGRLASYKYFNMDQAFLNALEMFDDIMFDGEKTTKDPRDARRVARERRDTQTTYHHV